MRSYEPPIFYLLNVKKMSLEKKKLTWKFFFYICWDFYGWKHFFGAFYEKKDKSVFFKSTQKDGLFETQHDCILRKKSFTPIMSKTNQPLEANTRHGLI
jgi:hypothetical protein